MNLKLNELQMQVHETSVEKGWWDKPRISSDLFCLFQSELYEAFEYYRKGKDLSEVWTEGDKREGIVVDLGDFIIRILDYLYYKGYIVAPNKFSSSQESLSEVTPKYFPDLIVKLTKLLIINLEDNDLGVLEYTVYLVLQFCFEKNMPIEEEIIKKAEYNKTRPYRHGNKVL